MPVLCDAQYTYSTTNKLDGYIEATLPLRYDWLGLEYSLLRGWRFRVTHTGPFGTNTSLGGFHKAGDGPLAGKPNGRTRLGINGSFGAVTLDSLYLDESLDGGQTWTQVILDDGATDLIAAGKVSVGSADGTNCLGNTSLSPDSYGTCTPARVPVACSDAPPIPGWPGGPEPQWSVGQLNVR